MSCAEGLTGVLETPPLWVKPGFLARVEADHLLAHLDQCLDWQRPRLHLYGRQHLIPRRQVWMGDPDARYRYSGQGFLPVPWHPPIADLRDRVVNAVDAAGTAPRFNSVLINRYADGNDRMGWHSDDEPELGGDPQIAAVSLGAERPLRFRWKNRQAPAFNLWLSHGSLLVMGPGVQSRLQHALLPRRIPGLRISLTFRHVLPRG
ncbi:alpha-ketoglutarate-dependent dioxygenase AlkB family protein [Halomonas halodenitrificans]|uniref:alpha-ketoglutarate-dependent dioxygenase AlkB family protein n=1 Tax=Halomonas halodenitrificans TaxID=28252 RepID=UPI0005BBB074|nr:alpha-ketoglutarate-dependent dioxygenase AlkB [Halomonas halodenitrificans]